MVRRGRYCINPVPVYSEASPMFFSGACSQDSLHKIAATLHKVYGNCRRDLELQTVS